jgi:hypothetical protein
MYKLSFYVPESHLEPVKNALFARGAGHYNAYDQCCWQVRGEGQFRPLVEMICIDAAIIEVVQTLLSVHPYEEPAYEIYKILTIEDF